MEKESRPSCQYWSVAQLLACANFGQNSASSLAPLKDQITTFYKPLSMMRLGRYRFNEEPYHHSERVAVAVEKAILIEEATSIAQFRSDLAKIENRISVKASEVGPGVTVDPEEFSDDEDLGRGTGALSVTKDRAVAEAAAQEISHRLTTKLKDFGVNFGAAQLRDPGMLLKKLKDRAVCYNPKEKVRVEDGSDYEGPGEPKVGVTPRKRKRGAGSGPTTPSKSKKAPFASNKGKGGKGKGK